MKRFFRTAIGKALLFIIITFALAGAIIGSLGMYCMIVTDVYSVTEEEYRNDVADNFIASEADIFIRDYFFSDGEITEAVNLEFALHDNTGAEIAATDGFIEAEKSRDSVRYEYFFGVLYDEEGQVTDIFPASRYLEINSYDFYTVIAYHKTDAPINGLGKITYSLIHIMFALKYAIYPIVLALIIITVLSFVGLMAVSGRHPDTEEVVPGPLMKIPFDVMLAVCGVLVVSAFIALIDWYFSFDLYYSSKLYILDAIAFTVVIFIPTLEIFLGLCMSFATRIKLHCLVKGTLIYMILRLIWRIIRWFFRLVGKFFRSIGRFFRMFPVVWRTIIILALLTVAEALVIAFCWYETDNLMIWWFIEKLTLYPFIIWGAFSFRKLQNAGAAMAKGNLNYKTDVKSLYRGFRLHGENLNSISDAMSIAVEDRLKSERMKTELITNVSHDIKTPLTSIINYSSLIGGETTDNEKITEYSGVLLRQSEKLKRLIDDLVEASKASTGAIDITLEPCDAGMFITQASGEYEDKLSDAGLTLVTSQPEKEVCIMADTRRMWRVFDNLMNNVCKYSQSGTRVYLSLEEIGKNAVVTMKNTSREPLNISAEELMERFVRGDSSRNTEGNGLGLSIAKSLVELQNGDLLLSVDGDLFKVTLTFRTI